jgi:hypothetical protein
MSGREASGIGRLVARLFPSLGSAEAAARRPTGVSKPTLAVGKPLRAVPAVATRSVRERDHERMQRRTRRTRGLRAP